MSEEKHSIGFMQVVKSVLSGMFGVQSSKNRERDFTKGKPIHYVVVGLLFTVIFILTLVGVVKLVLHFAGV